MSISERLKKFVEFKGISLKELSEKCDIPYRTLQNYIYEENRKISPELFIKLNTHFGINLNWLLTGMGEMFESETKPAPRTKAIVEMIENLDDSQKQKIYAVIEDAKQFQEMKKQISQLNQLMSERKTA
ncbi:helix-turn-helix domain-containing protein [Beggiatoa leptomitoformis]|nr:helix-turn-helix transcriptional regulator [Beggiatoa leptomitoformis]